MTLLIACILINHFDMSPGWYLIAIAVWWWHVNFHSAKDK